MRTESLAKHRSARLLAFVFISVASISVNANVDFSFGVTVEPKLVRFPGESLEQATRLTDVRISLRTNSVAAIEDYVVVQWIRGCQFETLFNKDGTENKVLNVSRYHFGEVVTFKHPSWEIDSDALDPAYSADNRFGRFALWRWNPNANSLDPATATYYFRASPPHPFVFLTDMPGGAFLAFNKHTGTESARNTSLEFKACIYRASDVPLISDKLGSNFSKVQPLDCKTWEHKYVFSRASRSFQTSGPIDPVCL